MTNETPLTTLPRKPRRRRGLPPIRILARNGPGVREWMEKTGWSFPAVVNALVTAGLERPPLTLQGAALDHLRALQEAELQEAALEADGEEESHAWHSPSPRPVLVGARRNQAS